MIGYLEGQVLFTKETEAIITTTTGVGYEVNCLKRYVPNDQVKLFITHICKEDSQRLYGFENVEEKLFFETLLKVKGVGPKSAHSLIASLGFKQILFAIENRDKSVLKKAPGVGLKAAAQILLDLESKLDNLRIIASPGVVSTPEKKVSVDDVSENNSLIEDAVAACVQLGFKKHDVLPRAIDLLTQQQVQSSEALVELLLKHL